MSDKKADSDMTKLPGRPETAAVMFLFCSPTEQESSGLQALKCAQSPISTAPRPRAVEEVAVERREVRKRQLREPKQYPALDAYSRGVRCMGLEESKGPVVLIVEDDF